MIERWLESRFGDVIVTSDQEDLRVNCPFCREINNSPDTGHHLYINLLKPVGHCFRCSWKGHWIGLVISVEGCSYAEALGYLEAPVPDIKRFATLYSPRGLVQPDMHIEAPDGFEHLFLDTDREEDTVERKAVFNYARHRLIKIRHTKRNALIERYFGWIPGTNRLWMLIDRGWWQGRILTHGHPRYLSPPWPLGDSLWNSRALERHRITICEGVFSAIHAGSDAIALCSKSMTKAQASRIAKSRVQEICIMLDADAKWDSYDVAKMLVQAGFDGTIDIHHLHWGDPCNSLKGTTIRYGFRSKIEAVFQGA